MLVSLKFVICIIIEVVFIMNMLFIISSMIFWCMIIVIVVSVVLIVSVFMLFMNICVGYVLNYRKFRFVLVSVL